MLKQILEFLLHSGWKDIHGRRLEMSIVYNSEHHTTNTFWELRGAEVFELDDVAEIRLDFVLQTFAVLIIRD